MLLFECEELMAFTAAVKTSVQDNATTLGAEIDPDITDLQSVVVGLWKTTRCSANPVGPPVYHATATRRKRSGGWSESLAAKLSGLLNAEGKLRPEVYWEGLSRDNLRRRSGQGP